MKRTIPAFAPSSSLSCLLAAAFAFAPDAARAQDGTLDGSFNPSPDGTVYAVAVQTNQKILVGGDFSSIGNPPEAHNGIARLNADGSVDSGFTAQGALYDIAVYALATQVVESVPKILVGGYFTSMNGVARNYIARLSEDTGALDSSFTTSADGNVRVIHVLPNNQILIGGEFTSVTSTNGTFPRRHLALLNANGTVDAAFNANLGSIVAGEGVLVIAAQLDGQIIVGGGFSVPGGVPCLARMNPATGVLDPTFRANIHSYDNDEVKCLSILPNGNILIGGTFSAVKGPDMITLFRRSLAEVGPTGAFTSFTPFGHEVSIGSLNRQSDGKIFVGGGFGYPILGQARNGMARLNADLTFDAGFTVDLGAGGSIEASAIQANGRIVIGGLFSTVAGQPRSGLARIHGPTAPEIGVEQPISNSLTDGVSTVDFGTGPSSHSFVIRNTGTADLSVQSAVATGDYSTPTISSPITVTPGTTTTLIVTFTPTAGGTRTGTLQIGSNDADENPFDVNLIGEGVATSYAVTPIPGDPGPTPGDLFEGAVIDSAPSTPGYPNSDLRDVFGGLFSTLEAPGRTVMADGTGSAPQKIFFHTAAPVTLSSYDLFLGTSSNDRGAVRIELAVTNPSFSSGTVFSTVELPNPYPSTSGGAVRYVKVSDTFAPVTGQYFTLYVTPANPGVGVRIMELDGVAPSPPATSDFIPATLSAISDDPGPTPGDLFQGATIDSSPSTPARSGFDLRDAFGVQFSTLEPGRTVLADNLGGADQLIYFHTAAPVELAGYILYLGSDASGRGASRVEVSVTDASFTTNIVVSAVNVASPYASAVGANNIRHILISHDFAPVSGQYFVLRVTPVTPGSGVRVIEFDGFSVLPVPEIGIEQPVGTHLADAAGTVNFGAAEVLASVVRTFTVTNTGNAQLTLTAPAPSGDFIPGAIGDTTLDPAQSTTFTVTFTPSAAGVRTGALHITSDDADESPFDIALTGTGFNAVGNAVFGWGDGTNSGIGDGTTTHRFTAVPTIMTGALANKAVTSVVAGLSQSFAISSDGDLFSWGFNGAGELGDGSTTSRTEPVAVTMSNITGDVIACAAGSQFSLALTHEGKVYAWGTNSFGQLGLGDTTSRSTPQLVQGLLVGKNVVAISAGSYHAMALTSDGEVFGWGANSYGVLSDGTTTTRLSPVALIKTGTLLAGKTISAILCSSNRTVALDSDGHLYAWGFNGNGQLGDGTTSDRLLPVAVNGALAGKIVTAVSGSVYSSHLALASDGLLYAWGANFAGQLGDGTTSDRHAPVAVDMSGALSGKVITAIHAGAGSLVRTADNKLFSWGPNSAGQLGVGTGPTGSNVPVAVDMTGALTGRTLIASSMDAQHALVIGYTPPAPEITVKRADNSELADAASTLDLTTALPLASTMQTVTIKNDGNAILSDLVVTRSGTHQAEFVIGSLGSTSLAPGATTTFTVTFTPTASGAREAALHIASDDANENPFDIALIGTGGVPITEWRQQNFSPAQVTAGDAADDADPDGDGDTNLLEFATRADPTDSSVTETPIDPPAGGFIEFTYTRNKEAMAELTYQVQWTDDLLAAWSAVGVTETIISDNGLVQQVTATVPTGGNDHRFVQLKVTRVP